MSVTPLPKFKTGTSIMGISVNVLIGSLVLMSPLLYALSLFMSGLIYLIVAGLLYWFVFLRFTEWVLEVIPPKYFQHMFDWVRTGFHLYITNDSSPLPMSVSDQAFHKKASKQPVAKARRQLT